MKAILATFLLLLLTASTAQAALTFTVFKSPKDKQWYWHAQAGNNEIIAQGEGYHNRKDALHAIDLLRQGAATASIKGEPANVPTDPVRPIPDKRPDGVRESVESGRCQRVRRVRGGFLRLRERFAKVGRFNRR